MIQYSQQQYNKDHSAVYSLSVLHFPPVLQTDCTVYYCSLTDKQNR